MGSAQTVEASEQAVPVAKANWFLRWFGLMKVPLIGYVRARIVESTTERTVVKVPLSRRTKNHLGSMYFGALAIGADLSAGATAMFLIERVRRATGTKVSLVFKDVKGTFLRRPDGDVLFECADVVGVQALVDEAVRTGERVERAVPVTCRCPSMEGDKPVAEFVLTLSLKRRD